MSKAPPFSIRFSERTARMIESEARRTGRTKTAVVESLVDEAARCREFPGIGFRTRTAGRRPWVIGTGLDVWQIVEAYRDFGQSVERMARETDLSEEEIRLAVAYYERYPEDIDEAIRDSREMAERYAGRFPTFYAD